MKNPKAMKKRVVKAYMSKESIDNIVHPRWYNRGIAFVHAHNKYNDETNGTLLLPVEIHYTPKP